MSITRVTSKEMLIMVQFSGQTIKKISLNGKAPVEAYMLILLIFEIFYFTITTTTASHITPLSWSSDLLLVESLLVQEGFLLLYHGLP